MVESTTLLTVTKSERKQPEVARETYELLKNLSNAGNDTASKGLIAYEILMMAREEGEPIDSTDRYEEFVDEYLALSSGSQIPEIVEKIKLLSNLHGEVPDAMDVFDSYFREMGSGSKSQLSLHLPPELCELYSYGLNRVLDRAVEDYTEGAFRDRADRIECKRDILEWIQDGTTPSHPVARDVVSGESERFDVVDAHEALMSEVKDWWERDDLTWDDIEHKQKGTQHLSKHKKDKRITAVANAWTNEPLTEQMTQKKIEELFNIKPRTGTSDSYMRLLYERYSPDYDSAEDAIDFDRFGDDIYMGKIPQFSAITKVEQAYLLNEAFKTHADENGKKTVRTEIVRKVMHVADWIPSEWDVEQTGRYIGDELQKKYDMDMIDKFTPSHIHLTQQ